jgi:putative spermidine/putrescine transport system ATP-binding protein
MATISLDSVTKRFAETTAVDDVSLTLADGEVLGVVGPSGCGKTTTLRTVAGFETPDEGAVRFDGTPVTTVPPERRNVGLVFQEYALFDNMTVRGNVEFGPKMHGVGRAERRRRTDELLSMLGISDLGDRDPRTLSGGQQQRVGLARALVIEPSVLLLDEPMTGLDAKLKRRLQREMGALLDDLGVTALYVTHDQEEAMVMCDRIAVMNEGRVEQVDDPRTVYERPANDFVAEFVGAANRLAATAADGALDFGFASVPAPGVDADGEVTVVARPESFAVGEGPIPVTVDERRYLGDEVRMTAALPDGETLSLSVAPGAAPSAGETVSLSLDPDAVHVLE